MRNWKTGSGPSGMFSIWKFVTWWRACRPWSRSFWPPKVLNGTKIVNISSRQVILSLAFFAGLRQGWRRPRDTFMACKMQMVWNQAQSEFKTSWAGHLHHSRSRNFGHFGFRIRPRNSTLDGIVFSSGSCLQNACNVTVPQHANLLAKGGAICQPHQKPCVQHRVLQSLLGHFTANQRRRWGRLPSLPHSQTCVDKPYNRNRWNWNVQTWNQN